MDFDKSGIVQVRDLNRGDQWHGKLLLLVFSLRVVIDCDNPIANVRDVGKVETTRIIGFDDHGAVYLGASGILYVQLLLIRDGFLPPQPINYRIFIDAAVNSQGICGIN